ncbi:MAG: OPT/YSL family transporter [Elusimicrobia bacterium]|nr:OPT/YSL family transporter [Elusimicrobiota bacterium]
MEKNPELEWLRDVYRPHAPQLTARAVFSGMLIGMLMCLSNLYVVLKTGWSLGVTITACILAFAGFGLWRKLLGLAKIDSPAFGPLENNAMSSVASAAGYMTGGGNMAAVPALLMLTGMRPDALSMFLWFLLIAALGVFAAIPIKRQLINVERIPFPTGIATAETLRALHAHGEEGAKKAKLLGLSSVLGAVIAWARDAKASWMPGNLPSAYGLPFSVGGLPAAKWTLALDGGLLLVGAGALMSFRIGWSLLLGAIFTYGFLAPEMVARGVIAEAGYKPIVQWTLWCGAAILVSSGLLSFAFEWRMVARSFKELSLLLKRKDPAAAADPLAAVECPPYWFPLGFIALSPPLVFLMWYLFKIPVWAGMIAIPLALVMGVIASRVTGETDVTPTKALGPVTQLIYGGLLPNQLVGNLMSANVTGGVGLHAADLLTDLKSGYLLGANPRQQLYGQLFGVLAGAAIVVPAFNLLVPTADILGSEAFPAPGVQVWAGVSKMLADGIGGLHPTARWAALIGFLLGGVLAAAEKFAPPRLKAYIPAPSGLGIAMVIPASNSISMFVGAAIAEVLRRKLGKRGDELNFPASSGLIAGESLMGILIKALVVTGVLAK